LWLKRLQGLSFLGVNMGKTLCQKASRFK